MQVYYGLICLIQICLIKVLEKIMPQITQINTNDFCESMAILVWLFIINLLRRELIFS
jgi:hypothetical protein